MDPSLQIPWLQNISRLLAPVAVPSITGTFMVVLCFLEVQCF
ncbi:hypothetical protein [Prochlorococcus sp. MIT 1306]